jgi:hypothetical protein
MKPRSRRGSTVAVTRSSERKQDYVDHPHGMTPYSSGIGLGLNPDPSDRDDADFGFDMDDSPRSLTSTRASMSAFRDDAKETKQHPLRKSASRATVVLEEDDDEEMFFDDEVKEQKTSRKSNERKLSPALQQKRIENEKSVISEGKRVGFFRREDAPDLKAIVSRLDSDHKAYESKYGSVEAKGVKRGFTTYSLELFGTKKEFVVAVGDRKNQDTVQMQLDEMLARKLQQKEYDRYERSLSKKRRTPGR